MYFLLISAVTYQKGKTGVLRFPLPVHWVPKPSCEAWNCGTVSEGGGLLPEESLTIKFVYCPPGISWSKTLESDARTFASKQPYNILT